MSGEQGPRSAEQDTQLQPFLARPAEAAVLTDIDGTLAPIVERPEQAAVPAAAVKALERLAERFALVGCVSGRAAVEARRLVGVEGIAYAGNHGLELLLAGEQQPRPHPSLLGNERAAADFVTELSGETLTAAGLRLEDKGPIQALHWRGADDETAAEAHAEQVAAAAERAGLRPHRGRKVLELRPPGAVGKGEAVEALLALATYPSASGGNVARAIYAGDDRTDLDAFVGLRTLRERGELEQVLCVGIGSAEAPPELADAADLTVEGLPGWLAILEALAGD
ncbi:MAG TPA: trehalose-phosphatase [Solirubrobacterales bacterium]|nr:trehalose-phosphatase [Solirubrobacterales bacterium]